MTTQTESEWEAEAMRLALAWRTANYAERDAAEAALRAHLATRPQVPEGMVLVPKVPDVLMIAAGEAEFRNYFVKHINGAQPVWTAMIAAATGSKA